LKIPKNEYLEERVEGLRESLWFMVEGLRG
jgi:hypothetical protein